MKKNKMQSFEISYYQDKDEPERVALLDSNGNFIGNIEEEDIFKCLAETNIKSLLDYTDSEYTIITTNINDIVDDFEKAGYNVTPEDVKNNDFVNYIKQKNGVEWYVLIKEV